MRKATKIWLVIATLLVIVGLIMFGAAISQYNWDFAKLSTEKYQTNIYEIDKDFSNLTVNTDNADIIFALSDDGKCRVECYEQEKTKHSIEVAEDTLAIKMIDKRRWYDYIGINFISPKITVYLPKEEYANLNISESTGDIEMPKDFSFEGVDISLNTGDVDFLSSSKSIKIKTSTGDICVENITSEAIELSASTGEITLSDVNCTGDINIRVSTGKTELTDTKCNNFITVGSTGDITLKNVIALEMFSIKRSTGYVKFTASDAAEISIETDTGAVVGNLLTDKIFITKTDTGKVNVPKTVAGGSCEITTDTGDIFVNIQ